MISILVVGDIVPINRTINLFKNKETEELFHDFIPIIKDSDISICNLEAPIVDGNPTLIKKIGPHLHSPKETIDVIKEAGFNTLTLANNHFKDNGQNGVECTLKYAAFNQINIVGGGKNKKEARKILYIKIKGYTIAIINICEHEFSIATENDGGSNPIDLINLYEDVKSAREKANFVIVITHGGIEGYQLPTPRMKRTYRHIIDLGADAVVNHHQHCFSGYELYKEKPIFYGIGNFCFDRPKERNTIWNEGYAVKLILKDKIQFNIIPYTQCNEKPRVSICHYSQYENRIKKLNEVIHDDKLLNEQYHHFIEKRSTTLLLDLLPVHNKYLSALFRRGIIRLPFSENDLLKIKNKIYCESHLENLKTLLTGL